MELFLKTPPVQEPVSIDEVRSTLRLSSEQEDDTLLIMMTAARAHVESLTGRALLKQEWQMNLKPPYPRFSPLVRMRERNIVIDLPKPPLLRFESITLKDEPILFEREGSKVILDPRFWDEEIKIIFWAGYGESAAALPPDLKMAILMVIRCLYDHQPIDSALLKPFRVLQVV
jgi:hypothetical protein